MAAKINRMLIFKKGKRFKCQIVLSDGWSHTSAARDSKTAAIASAIEHIIEFYRK